MLISKEEINTVLNNVEKYNFRSFFEIKWQKNWFKSLLKLGNRESKHPLFWLLLDEKESYNLSQKLDILKQNCKNYQNIIKNLIKEDFDSRLTEIEVMSFFYENFDPNMIEYESKIKKNGKIKKPDLKIEFEGKNYYIEILTLKEDQTEEKLDNIKSKITKLINELDQPYIISFGVQTNFEEENIEQFLKFIKDLLKKPVDIGFHYDFNKNGFTLADIIFRKNIDTKGFVGSTHGPTRAIQTSGRIKLKLLSKTEQLPNDEYNIIIIKLKDKFAFSDINMFQAFYGQIGIDINTEKEVIITNGFIHEAKSNDVCAVISYKSDFPERKLYLNTNSKKQLNN